MDRKLLRLPDVIERAGFKRSKLYALIARGEFPPPIKLGPRVSAWPSDEIDEWIAQRIAASREAAQ